MGHGPLHFGEHGAAERLRALGHDVVESVIDVPAPFPTEVGTSFALYRALSDVVGTAAAGGAAYWGRTWNGWSTTKAMTVPAGTSISLPVFLAAIAPAAPPRMPPITLPLSSSIW